MTTFPSPADFWDSLHQLTCEARTSSNSEVTTRLTTLAETYASGDVDQDTARLEMLRYTARLLKVELPAKTTPAAPPLALTPENLAQISAKGCPGISLVTCSMNREGNLLRALDSWLACAELREIIIVDWSSDRPVSRALEKAGYKDPRIRLLRVEDEPRWILSYAFNLGFRAASCERILKVDADIVLDPAFFSHNRLDPHSFIAGNWRTAETGQAHVNGFFYLHKSDLAAVAGFNEFITTYGWDDDDLYQRLQDHGIRRRDVAPGSIHHLEHGDAERIGKSDSPESGPLSAQQTLETDTLYKIRRNRFLANVMPVWAPQLTHLPFDILHSDAFGATVKRQSWLPHAVPATIEADASHYAALEMTAWRLGPRTLELSRSQLAQLLTRPFAELDTADVEQMLDRPQSAAPAAAAPLSAPAVQAPRPRLFVDGQHGLGNRLRAIGSAAAIAEKSDRDLVIVWQPDDHCDCRFSDIFDYEGAVLEEAFVDSAASQGCRLYNYMEVEEGAQKDALIDLEDSGDLYLRSAYVFNSPLSTWEDENRFLRQLQPVQEVRAMMADVRTPNDVSAHVRMVGGKDYEHLAFEATSNWTEEGHELTDFWRKKSHFKHFITRLDSLISEGRADRIFLAADKPETYAEFKACFGDRVAMLEREVYDRSAEQLRYALADVLLLASSPLLLGSSWSSFSELAMRLSPKKMTLELSGKDF